MRQAQTNWSEPLTEPESPKIIAVVKVIKNFSAMKVRLSLKMVYKENLGFAVLPSWLNRQRKCHLEKLKLYSAAEAHLWVCLRHTHFHTDSHPRPDGPLAYQTAKA